MSTPIRKFPFKDVVIIADVLGDAIKTPLEQRRDLEHTDPKTLKDLTEAVRRLGKRVHHYEHPRDLAANASKHLQDVVLSIFGGASSRNRMALVPAVCETFDLRFVGPDTYGRIICQDKEVSKALASAVGLKTASHRIVRTEKDINKILNFPLPYVAKPLWEGSSIGISSKSLITSYETSTKLLKDMLETFQQPILVESFIPGREVSWCFIEAEGNNHNRAFAELIWNNEPAHFDRNLYDAQHKLISEGRKVILNIDNELSARDSVAMEKLLDIIGHTGYGRIDGKFIDGEFVFLEITPDAWIGPTGTFATSFINKGLTFEEVIARVLLSTETSPQNR